MSVRANLTEQQARDVYAILVTEAGARGGSDLDSFVLHFAGENPTNEWRFCGSLGFGGKFRFPRMTVDCYPEDETAERRSTIEKTNAKLRELAASWGVLAKESKAAG